MTEELRKAVIGKAARAAFIAWFVGEVGAINDKERISLAKTVERYWERDNWVAGGKDSWLPAAEAALESVDYFKLVDLAEAALEFDKLGQVFGATLVTSVPPAEAHSAETQLRMAGKAVANALVALKEVPHG